MPVYEYRCNACHREFEYQQRMTEDDKVTCEACGKDALERLISRTAFQFKGGGWYKDLYSSTKPGDGGGGGGGGDSKPAGDSATSSAPSTPAPAPSTPSTPSSSSTPSTSGSGTSGGSSGGSSAKAGA